jgi:hypothetical protein
MDEKKTRFNTTKEELIHMLKNIAVETKDKQFARRIFEREQDHNLKWLINHSIRNIAVSKALEKVLGERVYLNNCDSINEMYECNFSMRVP